VDVRQLELLGRTVRDGLDGALEGSGLDERLRERLARRAGRDRRAVRRARGLRIVLAMVLLSTVAAAAIGVRVLTRAPSALSFAVGTEPGRAGDWVSTGDRAGVSLRFSDGSRLALDPVSRAQVVELRSNGAKLAVERGHVRADIVPRPGGAWDLHAGPFTIEVKGTRFDVSYDEAADSFELLLFEGHVQVSGCSFGAGRAVSPGDHVYGSCRPHTLASAPVIAPSEPSSAPNTVTPRDEERAARPEDWAALARGGHYDRAYAAARPLGAAICARSAAAEVLLFGDTARVTSHLDDARTAYGAVRRRFRGGTEATEAAFALGRLEASAKDQSAASRWFEVYLDEAPRGPLASLALGRLLEADVALGNRASSRARALRYLELYPDGPHATAARGVLERDPASGSE